MKPVHSYGLWLALLVLLTLSCQTVTGLVKGKATATPFRPAPTEAPLANPAPTEAPLTNPAPTEQPQAGPTAAPPAASGSQAPTLGTPDETKAALQAHPESVLEALANESYTGSELEQMNKTFAYTIDLPGDQPALWEFGWCAATSTILADNLKHISPRFFMNDLPVDISKFYALDSQTANPNTNQSVQCHSYAMVVTHWPQGQTKLETVVTFDAKLNDGMSDYQPGLQTFDYTVTRP
jgi:hypothetical protein